MLWISFGPIADTTSGYYGISQMQVNWLAMVFMVISIILGPLSTWFLDTCGLRASIILSSWLNVLGAFLRVLSCVGFPHAWGYPLVLCGQILCSMAQPLMMFAPTKLAGLWFPASERAMANTIATVANAVGVMLGNILAPTIVKQPSDIPIMNYTYSILAGVSVCLATCGVCRSLPPTPPTASAALVAEPFFTGVKHVLRNRNFHFLALAYGMGVALFTAVNTLMEQLLCPQGYSDQFAGVCSGVMIGVGLAGAAFAALYVDRTKHFEEVAKCGLGLAAVSLAAFLIFSRYPHQEVMLVITISLTGFFGFASNPICLELAVESTFPVAEASSAGALIISGQLQSFLCVLLMQVLAKPFGSSQIPLQTCYVLGEIVEKPLNYTVPNLCLISYGSVIASFFILFFRCDYKRMKAEKNSAAENLINSDTNEVET